MLRTRIITSIVCIPILIAVIWFGNPFFAIAISILAVIGGVEFYRMCSRLNAKPLMYAGNTVICLLCLSPLINYIGPGNINLDTLRLLLIVVVMIFSLILLLFRRREDRALNNWVWTIAGILYIGLMFSYWTEIPNIDRGTFWLYWLILTIMATDVGAYFTGRAIGKHLMAPNISPKKTWEGSGGGILASVIAAVVLSYVLSMPVSIWETVVLAIIISIIAQAGDLIESLLKRNAGVKDSGSFFPGHGGVLDRLDSYILIGPIMYYFILFFVL